jgi:hypothetical protein
MTERKQDTAREWVDPDDAPEWTDEMFDMAEISVGGKVIRPATGVLTKDGMRPIADHKRRRSSAVAEARSGYRPPKRAPKKK